MTPIEIIYRIHHDASRPEIHERPADYRKAVKRESIWDSLRTDEKRLVIALAEGEWCLLDLALEDIADGAANREYKERVTHASDMNRREQKIRELKVKYEQTLCESLGKPYFTN